MTIKENKFTELIKFKSWGCYPEGYNPVEHGPYDPSRYYGKRKIQIIFNYFFKCKWIKYINYYLFL